MATIDGTSGADTLVGTSDADTINGLGGDDTLSGNAGNDILIGGPGIDAMDGGPGSDVYYVDSQLEEVHETIGGGGQDRVYTSVSYTLPAGSWVERLAAISPTAVTAINLTGNELTNILYGNYGANVLNGSGGADLMIGYEGDDWYYVDNEADSIDELTGEGTADRVLCSVDYTLRTDDNIERLTTTNNAGTDPLNLSGNGFANLVYGNAGNNILDGRGGADGMVGFAGDDWYYVDNAADTVTEGAAEGADDRVFTSVSYTLGASAYVELLATRDAAATSAINLTGNALNNVLSGNAGANVLDGKAGSDVMAGLGGDDWYYVDDAGDTVTEVAGAGANDRILASIDFTLADGLQVERLTTAFNAGTDALVLTGNELANVIYGNAGDNVIDGRAGRDTLIGMGGDDTFSFGTALGGDNVDVINDFDGGDTIQLDSAVFTGLAAGALAAGEFNTGSAATEADDRVIYDSATGALLFDVDGVGGVAAVQFVTVSPGLALTGADFVVV